MKTSTTNSLSWSWNMFIKMGRISSFLFTLHPQWLRFRKQQTHTNAVFTHHYTDIYKIQVQLFIQLCRIFFFIWFEVMVRRPYRQATVKLFGQQALEMQNWTVVLIVSAFWCHFHLVHVLTRFSEDKYVIQ